VELGKRSLDEKKIQEIKDVIVENDLATIIYTSGTTGVPKGVMLSHKNLMSNTIGSSPLMPPTVDHTSRALSFLPLCHVYERMVGYLYHNFGVSIYYAESLDKIADNLKEIKPHLFVTVPRLLEKVYDKIMAKGSEQTGIKYKLFFWAVGLGLRYEHYGRNGWFYNLQLSIARKLIFSKWHEALGGNIQVIVSGGAPLQPRLARIFWAANLPVLEGYGLTETSPVIAVNTLLPDHACFGTVGRKLDNVEIKIAADGEILCKGPNVMMGYYKRPDLTAEVMDGDWFKTGDIGEMVEGKFLKITDRKKELLKTSGGKYIAPAPLENKMKESQFIEQIMVVGDNQKFAGALIVPSFAFAKEWLEKKGIKINSNEDLAKNNDLFEAIRLDIELYNRDFAHVEQIKKFVLLPKEFTLANNEMTPKLSLKRKVIQEHYKNEIERMYNEGKS
jgi:long-chain acyl-CoA synthetase